MVTQQAKQFTSFSELSGFIWSIADLLRGDYKAHDFGKVILPFTVLRRLDSVLEPTKAKVLKKHASLKSGKLKNVDPVLNKVTGRPFHNISKLDFKRLLDDPNHIAKNTTGYIKGFSENVRDIFIERFKVQREIDVLDNADLLFLVVKKFAEVDLHPDVVDNHTMGLVFEDLIRRFAEQSNETAGEHYTPREVIRLMVNLLFVEDKDALTKPGIVRTLYDPACGTGGMLSVAEEYLRELNPQAELKVFGQELNDETFAMAKADMLIKGQAPENIRPGNSFSADGHSGAKFDYCISNPPFGVEWKKVKKAVKDEHETLGFAGRFGAGLPPINDGSLLFLQHMLAKMKSPSEGGGRIALVFNGAPLFNGAAGTGPSEIRRWLIENDWLEAIIAMPDQLFFNTAISTYVWVLSNRKPKHRKGKIQLIDGSKLYVKMNRALGEKKKALAAEHIELLSMTFGDFIENPISKIFENEQFGYWKVTVERPLRLNFQASEERIARLENETGFANLAATKKKGAAGQAEVAEGEKLQDRIRDALSSMDGEKLFKNREDFVKALRSSAKTTRLKLTAGIEKAVVGALAEADESADICTDNKGEPEPDSTLRDTEVVPMRESIDEFIGREVIPLAPDAWVDESKTKLGYEIPFARHFFKAPEARPLKQIEADIRIVEESLREELVRILG